MRVADDRELVARLRQGDRDALRQIYMKYKDDLLTIATCMLADRAGKMFGGLPGARLEQAFGKMEFVRIVSIGEPTPHPDTRMRSLRVPCEVEIRLGEETRVEKFTPGIRANECQPGRWAIDGGI